MATKLYVGNISYQVSEDDLRGLFTQAGEVVSVKLITDPQTGRGRGFGFVEMATEEDAKKAISMFNGKEFEGRALTVNEARPQQKREGGFRGGRGRGFGGGGGFGGGRGGRR